MTREPNFIRPLLLARRAELLSRIKAAKADQQHTTVPLSADFEEQAIERENDEVLGSIQTTCRDELEHIDAALRRLSLGLYGVCEECGRDISNRRLEAVMHATLCSECAANNSSTQRIQS